MSHTTLHRTLTSTALVLLILGAPAAVLADPADPGHPAAAVPAPALAQLWLQELWSWLGGAAAGEAGRRPGAGTGSRRGPGLRALPQADGSYIDPNGDKTPVLLPPPPPSL